MKFPCSIFQRPGGTVTVRHQSADLGTVEVTAPTRPLAIEKMQSELRYRLELCPCTGEAYADLQIELVDSPP